MPHSPQEAPSNSTCCLHFHRLLNYGSLTVLSIATALLFLQTQAISLRLVTQQHEIESLKEQLQSSTEHIEHQVAAQRDLTVVHIAGTFTLLSCLITTFHMTAHLRKMNQPFVQRKILAILWMSPIYGVTSFLCLVLPHSADGYLTILKDFYESYVIYQFLSFLIAVLGRGDREAVIRCLSRHVNHLDRPYRWMRCLFHPAPEESDEAMAKAVLMECQVLGMQFVLLRPVVAVANFVLELMAEGNEADNEDKGRLAFLYSPKFILLMLQNISVFLAFSGLLKFYHAVRDELAWCQPFNKFLTIKGVVFMTFWQGLAISVFFHFNKHDNSDDDSNDNSTIPSANTIQHILICMEMLFFSIAHWCVFPAEEWEDGYKVQFYQGPGFGFKDFASDVSLIIDNGKKSIRARRETKRNGSGDDNGSTSTDLSNGKESPSFGSMDGSSHQMEPELNNTDDRLL
ncbi:hypothetical protein HJC23_011818 [Cyclotella cryptica]|uniref:DUF300-domain-containing protein n=1 Tax=Cyclotella cryptica TaxID=29204 RepID=A0ABD3NX95_9STRA